MTEKEKLVIRKLVGYLDHLLDRFPDYEFKEKVKQVIDEADELVKTVTII